MSYPPVPPNNGSDPYGASSQPSDPYGQPPAADPYGQPPAADPYGQAPAADPYAPMYGSAPEQAPYQAPADPYGAAQDQPNFGQVSVPPPAPYDPQAGAGYGAPDGGYGQAGYGQTPPAYGQYSTPYGSPYGNPYAMGSSADNGKGTTALVCGILSLVLCMGGIGIILGIVAIVNGSAGRKAAEAGRATNGGSATAGMVLGIIGVVLSGLAIIGYLSNAING